jgi:hypothetical protein
MKKNIEIWVTDKRMTNKIRSAGSPLRMGLRGKAKFGAIG